MGIKTIDKAIEIRFEEAHDAVNSLSETEREALAQLLKKMMYNIN